MEAMLALAGCSVAFASLAGYAIGSSLHAGVRRLRLASSASGDGEGSLAWFARNGIRPLAGAAGIVMHVDVLRDVVIELTLILRARGLSVEERAMASNLLAALLAFFLLAMIATSSFACAVCVAAGLLIIAVGFARTRQERRTQVLREGIPDVIRSMIVCFEAGMTLMQAMNHVAEEVGEPMNALFRSAAYTLETGGSTEEALSFIRRDRHAEELAFVAAALDVQHQSGGGVLPILESARQAAQDSVELQRTLRVQTAQAKLSARIVTVMPFVLVALFSLISEGFLDPFFESPAGAALLVTALLMQIVGITIIRHMLRIEVG